MQKDVSIRTAAEIEMARVAGQLASDVLENISRHVKVGISTDELDQICNEYIVNVQKAVPANVGYHGFPKTICASLNHVVCHGIPSGVILREGDILNIDVAVIRDGWYGDTSRMYFVGKPRPEAERLVNVTYEAMWAGIRAVRPKATLGDIGHAIQSVADREGFGVVRDFCGHGIGTEYHSDPQILHYGRPGEGLELETGMIFTIEPMLNLGSHRVKTLHDGWTVVTTDGSLSAQWEHMVAVTDDGFEVLTARPEELATFAKP
ncbi:MAG: type I methionyl aminopeptidase [Pseudomonas sp.]